jgi:hypothetical protein
MFEPCEPWEPFWACDVACLSPTVTGQAVEIATGVMWALSGRRFGYCTQTLRPCARTCPENAPSYDWGSMYPLPALIGGFWYNLTCGLCGDSCSCTELSEVLLPGPVAEITLIKIDGEPLVTGAYRVDNGNRLVRTDGGKWPFCNDLSKPDTEAGTWSVTYKTGSPIPAAGSLAVGELACELSKSLAQDSTCRLPRSVTSTIRQGVTINYADITKMLEGGNTGLFLVDLFIQTYNPHHLAQRPRVWSPDIPTPRTQTWP